MVYLSDIMLYIRGGFLDGPPGPGPPIFTYKNYLESYIYPYDNTYSSYIDLKCLLWVYVTVKIQSGNTSTHEYSSFSPSARLLCSIMLLGPPIQKFWIRPCICLVFLSFSCLV